MTHGAAPAPSLQLRSPGAPARATGAWLVGDEPGRRRFADLGALRTEAGATLPRVTLAYETWGTPAPGATNAVLVLHALTGDSHVVGDAGPGHPTPGWWPGLVGPGLAVDTDRYFVVAPNVLGGCQGSTGPSSPAPDGRAWGSRFPRLTVRDQVAAELALADHLGVDRWACVVGGSMGGMRALETAVTAPHRVEALLLAATCARTGADQIAWNRAQVLAVRQDPWFAGGDYYDAPSGRGPDAGLGLARRIAHTTYRSGHGLDHRFGRAPQPGEDPVHGAGRYAVESYLDHHADKLVRRFDANSYVVLTEAMNSHDVGRGRGGVARALAGVRARTGVLAVDSDRLFPPSCSQHLAQALPGPCDLRVVRSDAGHDGFLVETDAVADALRALLGGRRGRPGR